MEQASSSVAGAATATDACVASATTDACIEDDEFAVDAPSSGKLGLIFLETNEVWQVRATSPLAASVYAGCVLLRVDGTAVGAAASDAVAAIGAAADGEMPRRLEFRRPARPPLPATVHCLRDVGPRAPFAGRAGAQAALEVAEVGGRAVLVKSLAVDATALHARDLIREATILASLAPHPHVVRLRACAAPDVAPFVVVDLVDDASVDLEKRLREARDRNSQGLDWSSAPRWTAETGLDVAVQLGRAVAHLHGGAVLHRDLKPANVVLAPLPPLRAPPPPPGERAPLWLAAPAARYRAVLVDLGLAAPIPSDGRRLTAETGSARYMAPEVARGDWYGAPADVYSAALVAWAAVAADVPFSGLGPREHLDAVYRKGVRPPPPRDAPPALAAVLAAAWAPDPAGRSPVADLADGLVECLISARFGALAALPAPPPPAVAMAV